MNDGLMKMVNNDTMNSFLTKAESCEYLGVTGKELEKLIKSAKLSGTKKKIRGKHQMTYLKSDLEQLKSMTCQDAKKQTVNSLYGLNEINTSEPKISQLANTDGKTTIKNLVDTFQQESQSMDDFLTKKQASKSLGVSTAVIDSWTKSGKLPATKQENSRGSIQYLYHISDIQKLQSVTPVPMEKEKTDPLHTLAELKEQEPRVVELSTAELNIHTQALAALLQKQNELIVHLTQQIETIPTRTSEQINSTVKDAVGEITTTSEQTLEAIGQLMAEDKMERKLEREEESIARERFELKREERDIEITTLMKQSMAAKEKTTLTNRMKNFFTIPAAKEAKLEKEAKFAAKEQLKEELKSQSRAQKRARHQASNETTITIEG